MALAPDDWRLIAEGDSTAVPHVSIPEGAEYAIEINLPVSVPDWLAPTLASGLWIAMQPFGTVNRVDVRGDRIWIEMGP